MKEEEGRKERSNECKPSFTDANKGIGKGGVQLYWGRRSQGAERRKTYQEEEPGS